MDQKPSAPTDRRQATLRAEAECLGAPSHIEATAAHVVNERYGSYPEQASFQTLLGQAFVAVGLDAQRPKQEAGGVEGARTALSVALYELACAVNRVRNKAGSGHGRPFIPDLTPGEIRAATEAAGLVAGRLLDGLDSV